MSRVVKPALKKTTKVDPSNVTVVEVRYDAKTALSESNKLRIVIDNFDRILEEYKQPTKIPKLQKSKTCSIIESKCVLKKAVSAPLATSMTNLHLHKTLQKPGGGGFLSRTVSSCDVSAKKSKIPVMAALRRTFPSTPSGLNLPDRQKVSVQNSALERKPLLGGRFTKSAQNLNKSVLLSMPKRRDYVCGVAKSMENIAKSSKVVEQRSKTSVKTTVQSFESKTKPDSKGTFKKHNPTVSRTNTYTKTPKLKVAKQQEEAVKSEKCEVLVPPTKPIEVFEEKKPPPPKNKIIQLISTFERKSATFVGGYTSDNSDDSGNISNEHELDCEENSVLVSSRLNSSSDDSLLLSPDDSGIEKTPEKIFFRSGGLSQLEAQRDERLAGTVVHLQAHCRGHLARKKLVQRKLQDLAVRCIQRNVRKFMLVRDWPWWRLLVRVTPLLNVHRTEEELRAKAEELEALKAKLEKLEAERTTLKHDNDKLEAKLSELTADLAEEHSTATLASERLDAETSERMRLEKELTDVAHKNKQLQQTSERLEMELLYAKADLNGVSEDDEDGDEDGGGGGGAEGVYKARYERAIKELEFTKRRLQQQHEDDLEQLIGLKKQLEKKLTDAYEEVEEQRQVVGQWKRKVQKLNGETNDLRLLLEEQSARNNLLEKKQRKFDSETQLLQDELKKEKQARERLAREKEVILAEKYAVESSLADTRLELELKEEKLHSLQREFDELTNGGKTEEEVTILRRQKIDCERRLHDQEEELDELAGQVQLLEQAKLRLEMSLEQQRKEAKKEATQRDDELEEVRCNAHKKVKALEAQLENEHEERTLLLRERHELERRLAAAAEMDRTERAVDEATLHRLKRDLKKTRALLRDAQAQLERQKAETPGKTMIRQLKNQLEDLECSRTLALKAKQSLESELNETQALLDEAHRHKSEVEDKLTTTTRERNDLHAQLEENEEELAEVLKKYKAAVQQMSLDQMALQEQVSLVSELEVERNGLKEQLAELTTRLESVESMGDASSNLLVKRTELKVKELESKLDLEQTTRGRLEVQIARLKEAVEKLQGEVGAARAKEQQAQEQIRKLQRSLREVKEELSVSLAREGEAQLRRKELEKRYEAAEGEAATARADLRLALKRIEDLQSAIQGELEEDSTGNSETDHDSYSSDESVNTFLANHSKVSSSIKSTSTFTTENGRRLSNASRSSTSSSFGRDT